MHLLTNGSCHVVAGYIVVQESHTKAIVRVDTVMQMHANTAYYFTCKEGIMVWIGSVFCGPNKVLVDQSKDFICPHLLCPLYIFLTRLRQIASFQIFYPGDQRLALQYGLKNIFYLLCLMADTPQFFFFSYFFYSLSLHCGNKE